MSWHEEGQKRFDRKRGDGTAFKLDEGTNTFRILPNARATEDGSSGFERESPMVEFYKHENVGPNKRYVPCGKNWAGEGKCWLCDVMIPKLESSGKRSKLALAQSIKRQSRWVVQVAFMDQETSKWFGPSLWYVPGSGGDKSFSRKLYNRLGKKGSWYNAAKGYNLSVERTGMGKNDTEYGDPEPDDEMTKVPSAIMAKLQPFNVVLPTYSKEEQIGAWKGLSPEEMAALRAVSDDDPDDDDDDLGDADAKPTGKAKKVADDDDKPKKTDKAKKTVVADDDDDDDDAATDDDDDTDAELAADDSDSDLGADDDDELPPPPKKKTAAPDPKGKGKQVVADDDDDDLVLADLDDDDVSDDDSPVADDDDDPLPPPKKKTVAPDPKKAPPKKRR